MHVRLGVAVDGVRAADGTEQGYALLTDNAGHAITTNGGAPTNGYSMPSDEKLRGDIEMLSGHAPQGPDEVVIDGTSATEHDIALGSTIKVLFTGPTPERFLDQARLIIGPGGGASAWNGKFLARLVEEMARDTDPYGAAGAMRLDDIIDPLETRMVIRRALERLATPPPPCGHRKPLASWPTAF